MNRRKALQLCASLGAGSILASIHAGRASAQEVARTGDLSAVPSDVQALLDPKLDADLLNLVDLGPDTYYIIAQYDNDQTGEPVFIRQPGNGLPVIIADARALPLQVVLGGSFDAAPGSSTADIDLSQYILEGRDLATYVATGDRAPAADIDARVFKVAKENLGMDSKQAPGTNHGRLACAWAVNQIATKALGRPIGGGLATANMIQVLRARHAWLSEGQIPPGTVVISPTEYNGRNANVGHVGIVGMNEEIYSNSSSRGRWEQNFTVPSWFDYYGQKKGLSVQFYRLDGDYF